MAESGRLTDARRLVASARIDLKALVDAYKQRRAAEEVQRTGAVPLSSSNLPCFSGLAGNLFDVCLHFQHSVLQRL